MKQVLGIRFRTHVEIIVQIHRRFGQVYVTFDALA